MTPTVSWSEACLAMLAMMTVLTFVLIYYCCIPCYRGMKRRKQREEEVWENDPRWERENFSFVPRKPTDFMNDKKYSRLAACSRSSSMRSTNTNAQFVVDIDGQAAAAAAAANARVNGSGSGLRRDVVVNGSGSGGKKPGAKPPKYSELYETGSTKSTSASLGTPPRYTSKTPSSAETSRENVTAPAPPPAPKPKIIKPKKKPATATAPKPTNETTKSDENTEPTASKSN